MDEQAKRLSDLMRATVGRMEQLLLLPGGELRLIVASKHEVERGLGLTASYALISLLDPEDPGVSLPDDEHRVEVLALRFHDTRRRADDPELPASVHPITREQARRIGALVVGHVEGVRTIVVHCHHGMSRSPAVAAAIAEGLGGSSACWFATKLPNRAVYELVRTEWPA